MTTHLTNRPRIVRHFTAMCVMLFTAVGSAGAQVVADPYQSAVALLRQATRAQEDGSHLPLLFALRQLRDADLRGLFLQLTQQGGENGAWPLQVHGVLGLAEIDANRQIDPWLITKIAPQAQEAVIAAALDADMLSSAVAGELLQRDELNAMARMFLLAEQSSLGMALDTEELKRLSHSDDGHVAGLASALLIQSGDTEAWATFVARLANKTPTERDAITMWLMDGARRYRITALNDWIADTIAPENVDPDIQYRGTVALLSLDQSRGLPAWERYLGTAPSFPQRVRCGIILLAAREKAPASAFDKLLPAQADEELITCIANVGKALSAQVDPTDALIALLDIGHAKSGLWVMEYLKELPADQSQKVCEYLIDRVANLKPEWSEAIAQAVAATSLLFATDPEAVLNRLANAEDDSPIQQSLLLGLFESDSPEIGTAVAKLPRIGSGRADSLALLLKAKHSSSLTPDELQRLGTIACGGGRVSELLQVQAAWLYLKRSGKTDQAMAAVFAKSE